MTVKTKITCYVAGAGFIASLLFSVIVFLELIEQPFQLLDSVLQEEAYRVTRAVMQGEKGRKSLLDDPSSTATAGYWIEISNRDGHRILYRSSLAKAVRLPALEPGSRSITRVTVPPAETSDERNESRSVTFRVRSLVVPFEGRTFNVQIARPVVKLEEEIWELVLDIGFGLVLSTLALMLISRFIAGRILTPIATMKDLAQDISEKNLSRRIPAGSSRDEFSELARTINRMLDRLQYSFARQREFLFDTSHELKSPLTTIRLAIDEICAHEGGDLPAVAEENLESLRKQVLRMERLVRDLLNLSSLETLTGIEPSPVDISELVSSLAEDYQFLAEARNIELELRLPKRLIIQGDAEKIRRAFSNLLDNAIKYNVEEGRGRVEVTGGQSAEEVTVSVANTGPGVPQAAIPKVFDQFYRVEKSRSMLHGGSGLGLAIVKKVVELHGGAILFESARDAWTRVTVSLPK